MTCRRRLARLACAFGLALSAMAVARASGDDAFVAWARAHAIPLPACAGVSAPDAMEFAEGTIGGARIVSLGVGYSDYGKSEGSLEEQASLMKPILEKYLPNRVILAGHSLGGPLAVRMAMDYPELISGIVLVAPSVAPELEPKDGWYRKPMNWFFIRWMFPRSFVVSNQEILPLREELTKMLPLWKNINLPATVIQGDKDKFVPMENAGFAKKMLVNAPVVKVVMFPNGSHFILWTEYEMVVQEILGILYN